MNDTFHYDDLGRMGRRGYPLPDDLVERLVADLTDKESVEGAGVAVDGAEAQSTRPTHADTVRAIRSMLEDEFHPQSTVFGDVTRAEAVAALDAILAQHDRLATGLGRDFDADNLCPGWDGLPINIRVGRSEHGWWWSVYFGDGDIPGSLWGGAGTYGEIGECFVAAYGCYLRAFHAHPPRADEGVVE